MTTPLSIARGMHDALDARRPQRAMNGLIERIADEVVRAEGHGHVALLSADGRRVEHVEPFDNFLSTSAVAWLKWMVRVALSSHETTNASPSSSFTPMTLDFNWPGSGSDTDAIVPRTIGAVFVGSSTMNEAPLTENVFPGEILGSAAPYYSTAGVGYRGVPVPGSFTRSPTALSQRYEWGTTQANGAINTVGFAADAWTVALGPRHPSYGISNSSNTSTAFGSNTWPLWWPEHPALSDFSTASSTQRTLAVRQSDGVVFGAVRNASAVVQYTAPLFALGSSLASTSAAGSTSQAIADMAIDGTSLWYTRHASPYSIIKETLGSLGSAVSTFTKPWAAAAPGLIAANGTHLFACDSSAGTSVTIYKLSQVDGSTVASWTHDITLRGGSSTSAMVIGLAWDYTKNLLGVIDASGSGNLAAGINSTTRVKATWYDDTGAFVYVAGVNTADAPSGVYSSPAGSSTYACGAAEYQGRLLLINTITNTTHTAKLFQIANLGTRTKLGSTITKTSANSLRVVYDFAYS